MDLNVYLHQQLNSLANALERNKKRTGIEGLNGKEEYLALKTLEEEGQAHCTKCGETIKSDQDALCGNCI